MKNIQTHVCIIVLVMIFMIVGCGSGSSDIQFPFSSTDSYSMKYTDAVEQLREAGFTNIETISKATDKEDKDGIIVSVMLQTGTDITRTHTSFTKTSKFPPDSEITITYYKYEAPAPEAEEPQTLASESSSEEDTEEAADSNSLSSLQIEYAKAIAQRECDKYLSGAKYPKSGYNVGRFDDKGSIYVYTDQVELKTLDEKQMLFFVFTPASEDFDLMTNVTVHYLSVGDKAYVDDGYSADFFNTLNQMGD